MIKLPVVTLRDYQKPIWNKMMDGLIKIIFIVWHRRAGKDLLYLNGLISQAMLNVGNYFYILPQQNQVRRAIWEGITKDGKKYLDFIPKDIIFNKKEGEMKIIFKHPTIPNEAGSILSFIGGDNYDALAGSGISGCVISEVALQKPSLYRLIIKPMLKETGGFCWMNTTPRGKNHAYDLLKAFKEAGKEYYTSVLSILDTGMLKDSDLDSDRKEGTPEEVIQQEYYCSFEGAIEGSYYGDLLRKYEKQVGSYPYDARHPVHTAWDLGIRDSMAIWFIQFIEGKIHIIDYYENSTYDFIHYVNVIKNKDYLYASHNIPHDGSQRTTSLQTSQERALTKQAQLASLGLKNVVKHNRTSDVYGEIQSIRTMLSRVFFNKDTTNDGYEALKQYRREFDEKRNRFKDTPLHDWASDGADAFRLILRIQPELRTKRKATKWNGRF